MLGDNIKRIRNYRKLTLSEIANKCSISVGYLSDIENNKKSNPSSDILNKIAKALRVPKEYLFVDSPEGKALLRAIYDYPENETNLYEDLHNLTVEEQVDLGYSADMHPKLRELADNMLMATTTRVFAPIPVLGVIRAGEPIRAEQNRIGTEYIPDDMAKGGDYFGLLVKGDSMNGAKINDGDIVIVREQPEVENGEIAVVLVDGENATIKKYYRNANNVMLVPVSANPNYQPKTYDTSKELVKVLGKVVKVVVNL